MNSVASVLLGATAVLAVLDWVAVARHRRRLEYVAKPATLLALSGVALALDPASDTQRVWWTAALALSLAGDVFLMLDGRFLPGLASFLGGHLAYIGGFLATGVTLRPAAAAAVALSALALGPVIVRGARRRDRRLAAPVTGYLFAIALMVALALSSGNTAAAAGALLFFASDAMIGFRNFVRERAWHDLAIIVTYHIGQALLVFSLTRPVA